MKKILILLLCLLLTASITGCGTQSIKPIDTIEGNMKTYSEMSDGTWQCDGHIYKYRLEISGRLSNAVKDSTYIYLSNIEDITFEQAWKASGLSSNMDDFLPAEAAEMKPTIRKADNIAVFGFMKADKARKPCHLCNLDQGVVIILTAVYV